MKLALPQHDGRVSPVFDSAGSLLLVEVGASGERTETVHALTGLTPIMRIDLLSRLGATTLLCAGILRMTAQCAEDAGIEVLDGIVGSTAEVIEAYLSGTIEGPGFSMPGSRGQGRGGRGCGGQSRGGRGRGGQGRGRGCGGHGRGQGGFEQGQGFRKDTP